MSKPPLLSRAAAMLLLCAATGAGADCLYPDSERGDAPAWLCEHNMTGWVYLAIGDKSHMPSVSLQNRMAGKQAMSDVADALLASARAELENQAGVAPLALARSPEHLELLSALGTVKVIDKTSSPRRHLYVLAGIAEQDSAAALATAMLQLLKDNRDALQKQLGAEGYASLQQSVEQQLASIEHAEEATDD